MSPFTEFKLMQELQQKGGKIVLLVLDGLGGLPLTPDGKTELESAIKPNLDKLAKEGSSGLSVPIRPGIEPGSGPAHLSLFSYDPVTYEIGRGVLEALGIGFELQPNDIAARGNFATVDASGVITDRRAGRISSEECERLTAKLQTATGNLFAGYQLFVLPVKEHRFAFILRGVGLGGKLTETDPLVTGKPPLPVLDESGTPEGAHTAELVNKWVEAAREVLRDEPKANSINLRGLAKDPGLPRFPEIYGMRAAAIAVYPMYKGVARLVGMQPINFEGERPEHEIEALERVWNEYDFFFIHIKKTDSYGEDGNFDAKVHEIEAVDAVIPRILALQPGAIIVTGDHSTPAKLRSHSWHPVPTLLWSVTAMPDQVSTFGERACASGYLGIFHATHLVPLAMAHAGRLVRFGA
jgi:2,3-bisphosphoglycerate-independent phosphoglycerate mutase